jgi:hypothetical protein
MRESLPGKVLVALLQASPEKMAAVEQVLFAPEAQEGQAAAAAQSATLPGGLAGEAVAGVAADPAGPLDCKSALAEILRRIGAVAEGLHGLQQENGQLRNAKARLEQIVAEGLLKFLARVDAQSLKAIYAVLAKGDIAKAARELKMKDSTLRELVAKWKGKGKDYAVLADLVRWRKDTKFTGTVPFNEAVFASQASNVDYGALIADVLDGLLAMTEGNWENKREELAELLRPVVG